jgi:hypothetical protein
MVILMKLCCTLLKLASFIKITVQPVILLKPSPVIAETGRCYIFAADQPILKPLSTTTRT